MTTAVDDAMDWVLDYVRDRELMPGDRLPTEQEIADAAGVGRNSVREAVACMKVLGIVRGRPRQGLTLLRQPTVLQLARILNAQSVSNADLEDIHELRCATETGFAELICQRVGDATVDRLSAIVDEMAAVPGDRRTQKLLDAEFHSVMLAATGNRFGAWLGEIFRPLHMARATIGEPFSKAVLGSHRDIVAALAKRDASALTAALRAHSRNVPGSQPPLKNDLSESRAVDRNRL